MATRPDHQVAADGLASTPSDADELNRLQSSPSMASQAPPSLQGIDVPQTPLGETL